jgi:hypothetical protein
MGTPLEPDEIRRSVAAGFALIYPERGEVRLRLSLKYPVAAPRLRLGNELLDLQAYLDPAGDALSLPTDVLAQIRRHWDAARPVVVEGHSLDTGNRVHDLLPAPDRAAERTCLDWQNGITTARGSGAPLYGPYRPRLFLASAALFRQFDLALPGLTAMPETQARAGGNGSIRVSWQNPVAATRNERDLRSCPIAKKTGSLERAEITTVQGFVSPTSRVYLLRDEDDGRLLQVYIPGIFDAVEAPEDGSWTGDISIAAFSNDPSAPALVKGCLGSQQITLARSGDTLYEKGNPDVELLTTAIYGMEPNGRWTDRGPLLGTPFSWSPIALPPAQVKGAPTPTLLPRTAFTFDDPPALPPLRTGGSTSLDPEDGRNGSGSSSESLRETPAPAVVPLPATLILLGGALLALTAFIRR